MPPSKRSRVLPTSKTKKNHKVRVERLHTNLQSAVAQYRSIWVFSVHNARNTSFTELRSLLPNSRIFMGKTKVMVHALGSTKETAAVEGVEGLSAYLKGEVGLLFTDLADEEVRRTVGGFRRVDYARAGAVASRTFTVPRGELYTSHGMAAFGDGGEEPLPMSIEPTLRKLGVPTRLVKGKVVLEGLGEEGGAGDDEEAGYKVCEEGETLDSRQTNILKIFGVRMAEFKVTLKAVFEKGVGVKEINEADGERMEE